MFPEAQKELPTGYGTEQDIIDSLGLYIDYLTCLLVEQATKGSPEASACYSKYCTLFDARFPI